MHNVLLLCTADRYSSRMTHIRFITIVSYKGASQMASKVKDRLNSTLSVEKTQPGIPHLA
ncbi:hypothetical protein KSF_017370 [Reticulibacter mediterranei]|uniref:Uncharacterized protein n=1 Tax=Reticulibacter mediterranei TaxID=2778369 RepID=A0A8J3MY62_9CHLR|nr:hypothetical protein KSF_017370 [Reticulibacter mediterranei]